MHKTRFKFFAICDLEAEGVVSGARFTCIFIRGEVSGRTQMLPISLFTFGDLISWYQVYDGSRDISHNSITTAL